MNMVGSAIFMNCEWENSEDDIVLSAATFVMDIYKHVIIFVGNIPLCY
jgi:hypothetical protein